MMRCLLLIAAAAAASTTTAEPQGVSLFLRPAEVSCTYSRASDRERCTGIDAQGAYVAQSDTPLTLIASTPGPLPSGWRLFITRGPAGGTASVNARLVCGPTTSSRCGPVVVAGRRVSSPRYEAFRAVVLMASGKSFEASFYVRWRPRREHRAGSAEPIPRKEASHA
jgi:hypothetical protein